MLEVNNLSLDLAFPNKFFVKVFQNILDAFFQRQLHFSTQNIFYILNKSRDKSGNISANEIKLLFEALDINANEEELSKMIEVMDIDRDGEISFVTFQLLYSNALLLRKIYDQTRKQKNKITLYNL